MLAQDKTYSIERGFRTCRVHREIPYCTIKSNGNSTHKVDIAIFAQQDIKNINDKFGWLLIKGQYGDGSIERKSKINHPKRAVFCSHLIELKVPPRQTINYINLKTKNQRDTIKYDFDALRSGYRDYKYFIYNKVKAEELQKQFTHKLGNLTITAYNPNLSNSPFLKKRDKEDKNGNPIGFKNKLI